ncbi:MAG: hypothetical protein U0893_05725 [Chloroflexota bacterium]
MMIEGFRDDGELEAALRRREQFDINAAWLEAHGDEVFEQYHGQCICVSGGDVFAAESALDALALAEAAHPEDDGRFIYQVPSERAIRVYENRR